MKLTITDLAAFVAAVAVTVAWFKWVDVAKNAAPVSDWFIANEIHIPPHVEGENPFMTYDREVLKPFVGTWVVDIRAVGVKTAAVCTGSGTSKYEPDEPVPANGVTLSWYIGKDCKLPPGEYVAETDWEIRPEGYPTKHERRVSNVFQVLPRGSQLYVSPEQVQKLEQETPQ